MVTINRKQLGGSLSLVFAALIWGLSFVAQSIGMETVQTFTFNGIRMIIGGIVLLPIVLFFSVKNTRAAECPREGTKAQGRQLFLGGLFCGLALFAGSNLQQYAFNFTTVGKVGFVTALYMILVPIFGVFLKKKVKFSVWIGVMLGCIGLYMLCVNGQTAIGKGELYALACSVFFAIHILLIDYFASKVDSIKLSCIQFLVCGTLSLICMFAFEEPKLGAILQTAPTILYAGIMSCAVAFTLQTVGQKNTEPAIASLLLCLESVFSVLFGWLLLKQALSFKEFVGCLIMFMAIVITQLPGKKEKITNS